MSDERRMLLILCTALCAPSLTTGGWLQYGALIACSLFGLAAIAPWKS